MADPCADLRVNHSGARSVQSGKNRIAYKLDGAIAARFSDTVKLDLENQKELAAFKQKPLHYENQFDVVSGPYNFKVVFSSGGESFGKLEQPLVVDPNDGTQFSLSALALSKDLSQQAPLGLS